MESNAASSQALGNDAPQPAHVDFAAESLAAGLNANASSQKRSRETKVGVVKIEDIHRSLDNLEQIQNLISAVKNYLTESSDGATKNTPAVEIYLKVRSVARFCPLLLSPQNTFLVNLCTLSFSSFETRRTLQELSRTSTRLGTSRFFLEIYQPTDRYHYASLTQTLSNRPSSRSNCTNLIQFVSNVLPTCYYQHTTSLV